MTFLKCFSNETSLFQENDELKLKEKQQRQQIDLLEANEKELAKKNHSNQKVFHLSFKTFFAKEMHAIIR